MSGDANTLEQLSNCIAQSILQQITAVRETTPGQRILAIRGFLDGDSTSQIDFGSFDLGRILNNGDATTPLTPLTPGEPHEPTAESPREASMHPARTNVPRRSSRPKRVVSNDSDSEGSKRRKITGGLRLRPVGSAHHSLSPDNDSPASETARQLQSDVRRVPQRRTTREEHALRPSTLNKLIVGIWEQLFSSMNFDISAVSGEWDEANLTQRFLTESGGAAEQSLVHVPRASALEHNFSRMNFLCRRISQASRCTRALEVVIQAAWIEHFDRQVQEISRDNPQLSATKARMKALAQACAEIGWSEKEIRNKMAVWRGYKEIKDAGGYVCLVFAGNGIYRYCKYRVGFDNDAMQSLRRHRSRFEVAADTLHPRWREMLTIIDAATARVYTGHHHDWVVSDYEDPVPLKQTYLQWDADFQFTHLDTSVIDVYAFGATDPRSIAPQTHQASHICTVCSEKQSDDARLNHCRCFPNLYGNDQLPVAPVQIFRTRNGRNNGLMACCPIERGVAIGEFTGLVTKGLDGVDIMQAEGEQQYQIFQGREGNYTRFVNHSCRPNSQYERFVWVGVQRVILVSRGIEAGQEITVDYSDAYWKNLPKKCLCQESCCRFKDGGQPRIEGAGT